MLDADICGCSVFGLDDIFIKLRQFKEKRISCEDDRYHLSLRSVVCIQVQVHNLDRLFSGISVISGNKIKLR